METFEYCTYLVNFVDSHENRLPPLVSHVNKELKKKTGKTYNFFIVFLPLEVFPVITTLPHHWLVLS